MTLSSISIVVPRRIKVTSASTSALRAGAGAYSSSSSWVLMPPLRRLLALFSTIAAAALLNLLFAAGAFASEPTEVKTLPATEVQPASATLRGKLNPGGLDTHYFFEYFTAIEVCEPGRIGSGDEGCFAHNLEYSEHTQVPASPIDVGAGSAQQEVSLHVTGLQPAVKIYYKIVATNAEGEKRGEFEEFTTPVPLPTISHFGANEIHTDLATVGATLDSSYAVTKYYFEYGLSDCESSACNLTKLAFVGANHKVKGALGTAHPVSVSFTGLAPATKYYYRIVAQDSAGTVKSAERTFTTYPPSQGELGSCSNGDARHQTGAALLSDCRAYELVSAANADGYNVESDLLVGGTPYGAYPEAHDRVLYGVEDGGLPGTGHPTNNGVDPYLATRTENGWSTEYVGIPADDPFASGPFASTLSEADAGLGILAFGGPDICSPCFAGGYTGIPIHRPNGELVQGMVGSESPGPAARSEGFIARRLSADGTHLVFGSKSKFEPDANQGEIAIYDRNLTTEETHVASKTPAGQTMEEEGTEIGELDISKDGSRIVIGHLVEEVDASRYWHLYMNIGDSGKTIDLTPGTTHGVLFDGMSADGSRVFFTTADKLLPAKDTDSSPDIYMWSQQGEEEGEPLSLISTGEAGAGNSDACNPVNSVPGAGEGQHWNSTGAIANCGAVAIGGSGGVASSDGSIYFLSPELLAGAEEPEDGVKDAPNLYLALPGQPPRFIATLQAEEDPLVLDSVTEPEARRTPDFQVTPGGDDAVFTSTLPLTGYESNAHSEVFRYDAVHAQLICVSCDPTNAEALGDATLAPDGLSLTDDGRVFFTTPDPLVSRDSGGKLDVYEWEPQGLGTCETAGGCTNLISAGSSPYDSSLLSASAGGSDVYFFTRDTLAPQDENGPTVKLYDAREDGGFFRIPPRQPCQASDECHGPSSPPPPPA